LSKKQRWAATKSSRIRTALAQLACHDQYVLGVCYPKQPPGTPWHIGDPAKGWVDRLCREAQDAVAECKREVQHERSLARDATGTARKTRDHDGVDAAVARAALHMAAGARALSRQRDAEQVLRRASTRATAEAELAQARFEGVMREVLANGSDLAAFVHGKRVEVLQLDVASRPRRMTQRQRLLEKVGEWVLSIMGGRAA
jgi:hypothetical protein